MSGVFFYLAIVACFVTAGILLFGIGGFGTGKLSPRGQNKMMWMRIGAQFVAVVLIMATVYLTRGDG